MPQNRVWIRIINACNSKCIFCLDSYSHNGKKIESSEIEDAISTSYKKDFFNKIIISGGEASISPDFIRFISYAKKIGYERIQTITNGQKFSDYEFTSKAIEAGLQEITFSMHGHNPTLHDSLTGIPGSFTKALKGIIYIKKHHPEVIVNIDIVLNKLNIDYVPDVIRFFNKLGIYEFDLLQIIPFGRAVENKKYLFFNPLEKLEIYKEIGELSKVSGAHIWTNRLPAIALEGNEHLIQDPQKIRGEILGEGAHIFLDYFDNGVKPDCHNKECENCFIKEFCNPILKIKKTKKLGEDFTVINELIKSGKAEFDRKYAILSGGKSYEDVKEIFGEDIKLFKEKLLNLSLKKDQLFMNVPKCIKDKNNLSIFEKYGDFNNVINSLDDYVENYIERLYRIKSLRCVSCKYNDKCSGIHINFIKAYGFKILEPIINK